MRILGGICTCVRTCVCACVCDYLVCVRVFVERWSLLSLAQRCANLAARTHTQVAMRWIIQQNDLTAILTDSNSTEYLSEDVEVFRFVFVFVLVLVFA